MPRTRAAAGRSQNLWTREQLLLALNLYYRIPFGRQHKGAPEVVALAKVIDRTPSAVAYMLNNFTSMDPAERGRVKGLENAGSRAKEVWRQFHSDRVPMAAESEALWAARVGSVTPANAAQRPPSAATFDGPTESERTTTVRRAQTFFRRAVLAAYDQRCCVSDIPIKELLVASHIIPWADSEAERVNPANGLCLSRLHDGAFDEGLVTFDERRRLVLSKSLRQAISNAVLRESFERFEGHPFRPPARSVPDERFLAYHREHKFVG